MAIVRYWLTAKDAPYARILNLLEAYFHPEIRDDNFQDLVLRARSTDPGEIELATSKRELIQLLQGDRNGLHPKALATAAVFVVDARRYADDAAARAVIREADAALREREVAGRFEFHDVGPDEPVPYERPYWNEYQKSADE
jgi:hypothetical protein